MIKKWRKNVKHFGSNLPFQIYKDQKIVKIHWQQEKHLTYLYIIGQLFLFKIKKGKNDHESLVRNKTAKIFIKKLNYKTKTTSWYFIWWTKWTNLWWNPHLIASLFHATLENVNEFATHTYRGKQREKESAVVHV